MIPNIPVVELKFGGETYSVNYREELRCSEETINENLKDQPSFFAYYAVLAELADEALAETKLALEVTESVLDAKVREELTRAGTKATETMIRGKIVLDESYLAAVSQVNTLKKNVGVLKAIKEAFNHRKDMLVTLGANMRSQRDVSLYTREETMAKS
jgi:hypothetical protein